MRILMMTNTYRPVIGGLEKSIESFSREYRKKGHQVLIVAPEHKNAPRHEKGVFRVAAIQNISGTDFSIELPIHFRLLRELDAFQPDIVHAHHPFLIGDTALRMSAKYQIPIIFTHHTLYEEYIRYSPLHADIFKNFVMVLATEYANLCDYVLAPSESVAQMLKARGVHRPIAVIPTGIHYKKFSGGDGRRFREKFGIDKNALVIGIVSRIAPEKNIHFLAQTILEFLKTKKNAVFLMVGEGVSLSEIKTLFSSAGSAGRLYAPGFLKGRQLVDAYHAMDVFVFASHSETQGLVLLEAMASGVPVIAVDAPGTREVVADHVNGRLIRGDDQAEFLKALDGFVSLSAGEKLPMKEMAKNTAKKFSIYASAEKALRIYEDAMRQKRTAHSLEENAGIEKLRLIKAEFNLAKSLAKATTAVLGSGRRKGTKRKMSEGPDVF